MAYKKVIDISTHNRKARKNPIDFETLKNKEGIYGVIIRCGYGHSVQDEWFTENINGAIKAGLHVGIYWFAYCYNETLAEKEADACLKIIEPYRNYIDLGVWYDFEYASWDYADRNYMMNNALMNAMAVIWCDKVIAAGYNKVGIYYNADWRRAHWYENTLSKYLRWYNYMQSEPDVKGIHIWQYSTTASLEGMLPSKCDVNYIVDDSWITAKPHAKISADGKWGKQTTFLLQEILGTTVDGVISGQAKRLRKYFPSCYDSSWEFKDTPTGSRCIIQLQYLLSKAGYYVGLVDGIAGVLTIIAIQRMLYSLGYLKSEDDVDGILGPLTVTAFQNWLNEGGVVR